MSMRCEICPHYCLIPEGKTGLCQARGNEKGQIVCQNYGCITALHLDPIEKKPLRRFYPGSQVLSAGSFGCNLRCPFCQNHGIACKSREEVHCMHFSPEALVAKARTYLPQGNIGLAFTYNEPLIGYEYVYDCAVLCRQEGLKTVVVSNGYLNQKPFEKLLPLIDAFNIDLKSFSTDFYRRIGGGLEEVKRNISLAAQACHVEITTLIIPGENDSPEEMTALCHWLSALSPEIPLHISRFFPSHQMLDIPPTPVGKIRELSALAREYLLHVYEGNV